MQIQYISTNQMVADMLTKGLRKYQFEYCRDHIGLLKGSVENGDRLVDVVELLESWSFMLGALNNKGFNSAENLNTLSASAPEQRWLLLPHLRALPQPLP